MSTTTVRVTTEIHTELQELARASNQSMARVLEQALDVYKRQAFFRSLDAGYDRLWADPAAREEELAERAILEGSLLDDLVDD